MSDATAGGSDDIDALAEEIATSVVNDYLLTPDEITAIADAINDGRVAALIASYIAAVEAAGIDAPAGWNPSEALVDAARDAADEAAQSIADTYADDLTRDAASYLQVWIDEHDGEVEGSKGALRDALASICADRAEWKSEQVAGYETGVGGQAGTQAAVSDIIDGALLDDNGDPLDTSLLAVAVLPETTSADFCAEYAGNVYAFDDAPSLTFPAHLACQHFMCVLVSTEYSLDFGD